MHPWSPKTNAMQAQGSACPLSAHSCICKLWLRWLQSRPFGVALLIAGWDEHGPLLWVAYEEAVTHNASYVPSCKLPRRLPGMVHLMCQGCRQVVAAGAGIWGWWVHFLVCGSPLQCNGFSNAGPGCMLGPFNTEQQIGTLQCASANNDLREPMTSLQLPHRPSGHVHQILCKGYRKRCRGGAEHFAGGRGRGLPGCVMKYSYTL